MSCNHRQDMASSARHAQSLTWRPEMFRIAGFSALIATTMTFAVLGQAGDVHASAASRDLTLQAYRSTFSGSTTVAIHSRRTRPGQVGLDSYWALAARAAHSHSSG